MCLYVCYLSPQGARYNPGRTADQTVQEAHGDTAVTPGRIPIYQGKRSPRQQPEPDDRVV